MARLKELYVNEVAPALMKKFEYKSPMQIPKFDKIVINVGAGDAKENSKVIDAIIADPKSEEILTEELYTLINNIDAKDEALVLEAKTAGEAIVYDYAVNVYNKDKLDAAKKAYDDWAAKYGMDKR